ncbi:hypothetical protein [Streptomyces sp. NPDC006477]|uniref:hypothetical protein n=1 Tax=Streptomyces sp. NPDC006477 TaxID=3364747 RepID=UPI00368E5977
MSTPPDPKFTHGSKAEFWIGTADAPEVLVDVSDRLNNVGLPWQRDKGEVSTFKSTTKKYVGGLKDAAFPMEGPYDPWLDGILDELINYDSVVFRYRPIGTGTGKPEYNGRFMLTKHEIATEVGGPGTISAEGQVDGEAPRSIQA